MINVCILDGRLTADAELKTTNNGTSVTQFNIAVDRPYKQGEDKEADFITIVAWQKTAEFVTKYFKKGSRIGIEGRIQTRKYTDKNGNNRMAFEVVAHQVHFMESKKSDPLDEFAPKVEKVNEELNEANDDLPF